MNVRDIEIPYVEDRGKRYRFFEILPGLLTWTTLVLPFILSLINPTLAVFFILVYIMVWFVKSMGLLVRNFQGLRRLNRYQALKWNELLDDLENRVVSKGQDAPDWHHENVGKQFPLQPSEIYHAVMIAAYNESREVLEPTIQSVIESDYDTKKVILVLAYEERDGARSEQACLDLAKKYGSKFAHTMAVKHPLTPNEIRGKGGNITYAARKLESYLKKEKIDPIRVVVTTLDADNRPHKEYLACLTYLYVVCPSQLHSSFQPVIMYTNNIWDAPAPMRVIATGNGFWNITLSMRPHMIRNFSSHAQGMQALIDTDYWSVRTVVEDGHQFWRTYFRYDGKHEVYPLYVPIYQDAVFAASYKKTLRMQFIQLRRWAWGASDIAYVTEKGFFTKNKVPRKDLIMKLARLIEGHLSWSTAPLILLFSAFIPAFLSPKNYAANQLPLIASQIQRIAMVGILATLYLSLKTLPPKPAHYKNSRHFFMVIQWIYLPVTTILYNCFSAINSQTRLMFGRYLGSFDVTEKAVRTKENKTVV